MDFQSRARSALFHDQPFSFGPLHIEFFFSLLKFIYSEKATKFCEIFLLLLTAVHTVKSKGKISQNFVAFSEYMNFNDLQPKIGMGKFFGRNLDIFYETLILSKIKVSRFFRTCLYFISKCKNSFSFHLFTFVDFFLNVEDVFFKLHNQYYHIIREEDWLCTKDIDRKEAIELLSKHPEDGTFLVRQRSSSSHFFTIP